MSPLLFEHFDYHSYTGFLNIVMQITHMSNYNAAIRDWNTFVESKLYVLLIK